MALPKHFTLEQLSALITGIYDPEKNEYQNALKLSTTIAKTEVFEAFASDLPLNFIVRCLKYGFQRHFNDSVVSIESVETKVKTVSLNLGEILAGKFEKKARKETIPTEINVRRKVVLNALSKADKESLADLSAEKLAEKLDELFVKNEEILRPVFEEEMRPKMKVSVKL